MKLVIACCIQAYVLTLNDSIKSSMVEFADIKFASLDGLLYDQATQDGCSLALCTSSDQPVPASPIPYSPDRPSLLIIEPNR